MGASSPEETADTDSAATTASDADVDVFDPDAMGVDMEDLFEALRQRRRRFCILIIDQDGPIMLADLADRLTAYEKGEDYDSKQRKATYVALYQVHSETMADANLVAYDKRSGRFSSTMWTELAAEYIRRAYDVFGCDEGSDLVLRR